MKNFTQKKIALAVGASLLVMAGAANAALPTLRTAGNAMLITTVGGGTADADIKALYTTKGLINKAFTFDITLNSGVAGTGDNSAAASAVDGTIGVVGGPNLVMANATLANNHVVVYTGTTATQVPSTGATAVLGATTAGVAHITVSMPTPGANKGYRLTAGALEYSADTSVASPTWTAVKVDLQKVTGSEIYTESNTTTGNTADATDPDMSTITGTAIGTSLAPTPVAVTTGSPTTTAPLINGISVDTVTPIDAFTIVTNVAVTPTDPGGLLAAVDAATDMSAAATAMGAAFTATSATATLGATVAGTATTPSTFKNTITFLAAADWTNGPAADDLIFAASPKALNTGVTGATLPIALSAGTTPPKYTQVFNTSDGVGKTVTFGAAGNGVITAGAAVTDGVAPILVAAETNATNKTLELKFSESMVRSSAGSVGALTNALNGDLQEVAENVSIVNDSLAAVNLNNGGNLSASVADATGKYAGQSLLTITDATTALVTAAEGKSITVKTGIGFVETNDAGYDSSNPSALDGTGLKSATLVKEAASGSATATAAAVTIAFNDTSCGVATTTADATKIGLITCTFPAGKGIGYATGKTFANLTGQIVVTVTGTTAANKPDVFQFFPTAVANTATPAANQMAISSTSTSGSANAIVINVPTDLIYAKLKAVTGLNVKYLNADANTSSTSTNVLVGSITAAPVVSANNEDVVLPLSASAASTDLLTQSISGTLSGASNGSLVHAHLWKWQEVATFAAATYTVSNGRVTNPGDKVATDLAIQYATGDLVALQNAIGTSLNAVAAAKAAVPGVSNSSNEVKAAGIPVYIQLIRSSDTQANTKGLQNYHEARAILSTVPDDAEFKTNTAGNNPVGAVDANPVYFAMLDPVTGNINGRLTGKVDIKRTAGGATFGPAVVTNNVASGLVASDGKFNLIVATDPSTADIAKGMGGVGEQFLILVHEDQSNARKYTQLTSANKEAVNYLPYEPNLFSLKGTRTVLGTAPGNAGRFVATTAAPTASSILLSNQKVVTLSNSTAWQLFNMGAPAGSGGFAGPRGFLGISADNKATEGGTGAVTSYWMNDGSFTDMAFAMAGNKVGVTTELATGAVLSNMTPANFVGGVATLAVKNDAAGTTQTLTFPQGAPVTAPKVQPGWSLVSVPASGTLTAANVEAVLKVGFQSGGDTTWFKADGAIPTYAAGTPVFVYSPKGGNL